MAEHYHNYTRPDDPGFADLSREQKGSLQAMRSRRLSLIHQETGTGSATYQNDLKNLYNEFRVELIRDGIPTGGQDENRSIIVDHELSLHIEENGKQVVLEEQRELPSPLVLDPRNPVTRVITAYRISPITDVFDLAKHSFSVSVTETGKTPRNTDIVLASYDDTDIGHQENILTALKNGYAKLNDVDMRRIIEHPGVVPLNRRRSS